LGRPNLNLDISSFGQTKIVERFAKRSHRFRATDEKYANAPRAIALLRAHIERPRDCCAAYEHDECASPHSITSSARASIA
jgi:hypothetical protein